MKRFLTFKEYKHMTEEYDKVKYMCKCGHRNIIPKWRDKTLCSWCNRYVFKNKRDEFKFRLKEKILNRGFGNNGGNYENY